jgi:hypothetical protein
MLLAQQEILLVFGQGHGAEFQFLGTDIDAEHQGFIVGPGPAQDQSGLGGGDAVGRGNHGRSFRLIKGIVAAARGRSGATRPMDFTIMKLSISGAVDLPTISKMADTEV